MLPSSVIVPPPSPPPQRKGDATRARILEAAARVLTRSSYTEARLADIAAEAGMQAGSLYYHFASREALIEEVMLRGVTRTEAAVRERLGELAAAPARARIEAAIATHLILGLEQSDFSMAAIKLVRQLPEDMRARVVAVERRYGQLWRDVLEAARDAGEIRADLNLSVVRMAVLGALNWSPEWYRPDGAPPEEIARDIASMVLDGLVP